MSRSTMSLQKIKRLKENSNFLRNSLMKLGFCVLGTHNSPIVPVLVGPPGKLIATSRECLKRGLAVVAVSFPATSITTARIRICVSAAHTRKELKDCVKAWDEIGDL